MISGNFTLDADNDVWFDQDDHGENRRIRRRRRTRARQIAYTMEPQQQSESTGPLKRLKSCGLARTPDVNIMVHNHHAYASGLIACGNVWTCATCSARIEARRCLETQQAYENHVAGGGTFGMLTMTLRHKKDTPLAVSLENLNHAWARLQQRRAFKPLWNLLAGTIVTVEITYGANGWHPHLHIVLLAGVDTSYEQVKEQTDSLRRLWSGLVNSRTNKYTLEHGLNLVWFGQDAETAAKYTHKIAREMTLSANKTAGSTKHPLELLDRTDDNATTLFLEYAAATSGRQKHRWSNGLRRALAITEELTNEQMAENNATVGVEVLTLSKELWNSISEDERLAWLEFAEAQHFFTSG